MSRRKHIMLEIVYRTVNHKWIPEGNMILSFRTIESSFSLPHHYISVECNWSEFHFYTWFTMFSLSYLEHECRQPRTTGCCTRKNTPRTHTAYATMYGRLLERETQPNRSESEHAMRPFEFWISALERQKHAILLKHFGNLADFSLNATRQPGKICWKCNYLHATFQLNDFHVFFSLSRCLRLTPNKNISRKTLLFLTTFSHTYFYLVNFCSIHILLCDAICTFSWDQHEQRADVQITFEQLICKICEFIKGKIFCIRQRPWTSSPEHLKCVIFQSRSKKIYAPKRMQKVMSHVLEKSGGQKNAAQSIRCHFECQQISSEFVKIFIARFFR